MQNSKIEWTHHTFNPWWGCVHCSPACDHCYAERMALRMAERLAREHEVHLQTGRVWGKDADRLFFTRARYWAHPLRWDRSAARRGVRRRVFCASMCDIMERNDYEGSYIAGHVHSDDFVFRPDELTLDHARQRLFRLIEDTPNLNWLLLTKRPQEFRKLLPAAWLKNPRPNVWLLTTVESPDYLWRIQALLDTPAVVHGVSMEPLLGPVKLPHEFLKLRQRAWVITGGESGPGARPSQIEWIRKIRDTCVAAGVPFHFKQWGEYGADLIKIGKKTSGRMLDGREWDEFPMSNE